MSNKRADDDEAALGEKFDTGRKEGLEKITRALTPEPENYVETNPAMKDPDYMAAGMELETNPYLKDSDIGKSLVAKAIGGQANRYPSYQFLPTAEGYARGNRRTGNIEQVEGDFLRSQDNPRLQGQLAGARGYAGEASKNKAALATEPQVVTAVTQAEKDVKLEMDPKIERAKADAIATQERAFNMQGAGDLVKEAEGILTGTGKDRPTGSWIGSVMDFAGTVVGKDVPGSIPAESLKTIGAALTSKTPRFEGPQGVYDVSLYEKMAGSVGNSNISPEKRMAALEQFKKAFAKYEETAPGVFTDKTKISGENWAEDKEKRYQEWKARQ